MQKPRSAAIAVGTSLIVLAVLMLCGCRNPAQPPPPPPPPPPAPVAGFSMNRTSGDAPLPVQFTDHSQNAVSWNWDFGDGATSTSASPSHTYSSLGVYSITLRVRNAAGATQTQAGKVVVTQVVTVPAATYGPYSLTHVGTGDCEFGGNGPHVVANASLATALNRTQLFLDVSCDMRETKADWTECSGSGSLFVYAAPAGTAILDLPTVRSFTANYIDTNTSYDYPPGTVLGSFKIMGDTNGNDACGQTSDDSHLIIRRNAFSLRIAPASIVSGTAPIASSTRVDGPAFIDTAPGRTAVDGQ
jgi:PKD repeat protein